MEPKPLGDKIILLPEKPEENVAGTNLIIPDTVRKPNNIATVVAVGSGKTLSNGVVLAPPVKVGAKVLFAPQSSVEITLDGQKFLIVSQDSLLAEIWQE